MNTSTIVTNLTHEDTTSKSLAEKLPPNSFVYAMYLVVSTAFNGTGANTVDVGYSGDTDYFLDGEDVSSAGVVATTLLNPGKIISATDAQKLTAIYIDGNGDSSAGEARIVAHYAFKG